MNYGELKTAVRSYSHRTDLDTEIPLFIQLAESRLSVDTDMPENDKTLTFDTTVNPFPLPIDYVKPRLLTSNGLPQTFISEKQLQAFLNQSRSAVSSYWTVKGRTAQLARYSDGMAIILDYTARLVPLVNDNDETELLSLFPQAYLYGALQEAFIFMQDLEAAQGANIVYQGEIDRIKMYSDNARLGDDLAVRGI